MTINKKGPSRILLMGLTSSALGGMEYHNLGNYIIMEPFIVELQKEFPEAIISTSIQMSDDFCNKFKIIPLRKKRFWTYGRYTTIVTICDLFSLCVWKSLNKLGINFRLFVDKSSLLSEIDKADLFIDFSGDIYGDNSHSRSFIENNARLLFSLMLNKPTVMLIGSPGPFRKIWRLVIAKYIMKKLDLVTNREPVSTEFLEYIGIKGKHVVSTACPSVFFKKDDSINAKKILEYEEITPKLKPTIGLIICGWNMGEGPFNKWPRSDVEYGSFVKLIAHLINNLNVRVCLMSHQNATDKDLKLLRGNDHRIIEQLLGLLRSTFSDEQLFTLKGLYNAAISKTIIGQFDMLISGRIHGAVQGLSQSIPTVIIDYGHEPKAHKLKGFGRLYGVEEYVCDPNDADQMILIAEKIWKDREAVKQKLQTRIPQIENLARMNFSLTRMSFEKRIYGHADPSYR